MDRAIFRTVCWFSLFDYPLTAFEIWKWLFEPDRPYALEEVYDALASSEWLAQRVEQHDGFWWPIGRGTAKGAVVQRRERFVDAMRKYAKLRRALHYIRLFPSVQGVAAVNTLAWWNTRPDSDIDLLIIVRPGSIWLSRLFLVAPFALLKLRPADAEREDPFCFSFFTTTEALGFEHLQLGGGDPYLVYWSANVAPVLDRSGVWERFAHENRWVRARLPHAHEPRAVPPAAADTTPHAPGFAERFARRFQEQRFPEAIHALKNKDTRVVISDHMLKFHDNDRREEYRERWHELV